MQKRSSSAYYDTFDPVYHAAWGTALHHGWFASGEPGTRTAVALERLREEIVTRLELTPECTLCDVGCGYGDFCADLVRTRKVTAATGVTDSGAQVNHFRRLHHALQQVEVLHVDWLRNGMPAEAFDRLVAIESLYHFADTDKAAAIREMARVLRPGGRAVVTLWQCREPSRLATVVDRGMCAWDPAFGSLATPQQFRCWFAQSGLRITACEDITAMVRPTIPALMGWAAASLWTEPAAWLPALRDPGGCGRAGVALASTWFGYATGALRYVVAVLEKP